MALNGNDTVSALSSKRPLSIYIIHPSDELTDHLPSGDGLIAYGFIAELAARGHNIHVATPCAFINNALPGNVKIHLIDERPLNGYLSRIRYAIKVRRLYERLRTIERFDVVQQMNPVTAGLSLGMIGIKPPLILGTFVPRWPYNAHQVMPQSVPLKTKLAGLILTTVSFFQICFAKALLVTSTAATSRIPLARAFTNRTFEVHHGIDTSIFCPSMPEARSKTNQRIVFLGSLWVRKGILTLIEAFQKVYQANPQATLVIAGGGEIEAEVRAKLEPLSCAKNVEMLGGVSRLDVPDLMRSATVCCAPGYSEPYATAVIEAMSCGSAVVVSDSGGVPYMVPRLGGRCVSTRDVDSLADALISLLEQPGALAMMGQVNRAYAIEQYSWPSVVQRLEAVYTAVIDGRPISRMLPSSMETFGSF